MPASYDDLCQRYESCVKNIQDSIYTLESFMGNNTAFTFNMVQSLGNLDELDVTKEEKAVELQIKVLEEYRKVQTITTIAISCLQSYINILVKNALVPPIFTHQFEKTYSFHQIVHTNFPKYSFHQIVPKYSFHQFEPTGKSSDALNIQWHFFKKMPWSIVHYYSKSSTFRYLNLRF